MIQELNVAFVAQPSDDQWLPDIVERMRSRIKRYPGARALSSISWQVREAEFGVLIQCSALADLIAPPRFNEPAHARFFGGPLHGQELRVTYADAVYRAASAPDLSTLTRESDPRAVQTITADVVTYERDDYWNAERKEWGVRYIAAPMSAALEHIAQNHVHYGPSPLRGLLQELVRRDTPPNIRFDDESNSDHFHMSPPEFGALQAPRENGMGPDAGQGMTLKELLGEIDDVVGEQTPP